MSIRKELLSGFFWSAVEKYSSAVISLLVTAILARLLTPADFGTISIVTVIITFLTIFSTLGIAPAIVQFSLSKENLNSIFSFTVLLGCVLGIVMFFCAPLIAVFYHDSTLTPLCRILSVSVFFASTNLVPNSLMLKYKRFKLIAKRTLILNVSSGILAIIAALNGFGVYALLISPIIYGVGIFIYNYHYYPLKASFRIDFTPLKRIFSYSTFQFFFEFINFFSRNSDKLIIGKTMNMGELGYYDKSYRLMLLPLQYVTMVIGPVLQPVLSHLQNDMESMCGKYTRLIKVMAFISFPLSVLLYFCAHDLINIVFGCQWEAAVPCFRILSISVPFQLISSTCGSIFQASNATKLMFFVGLRNTFFTLSGIIIGAIVFKTIEAVAWAWNITILINFITSYNSVYKRLFHRSSLIIYANLVKPAIISAVLIFVLFSISQIFIICNIYLSFFINVIVSSLVYILSFCILMKQTPMQVLKSIKEVRK